MEAQEIRNDIVFVILYGGVIMLSVAAALYLLFRRGNAFAPEVTSPVRLRRWAAAFMAACALSHVTWLFYSYQPTSHVYTVVCSLDLLMLLPTISGILLSMLQDKYRPVWPVLVALVPAFVLLALNFIMGGDALVVPIVVYVVVLYALLMLFIFFAVRRYRQWLRDNYADLENKEVWYSFLILALFLLFFVIYSSNTDGRPIIAYLLQMDCIIIVVLLLWRVENLQQLSEISSPDAEPAGQEQEEEQNATTSLPAATANRIETLLKKHCEDEQIYLQNDLSLAQLANVIATNRTYLSQHFAQQGITYNAYINGLRIRHFIRLYQEAVAEQREITAQQLAFESGYRSYSTFSAAFKQHTGKTVTAWMHNAGK